MTSTSISLGLIGFLAMFIVLWDVYGPRGSYPKQRQKNERSTKERREDTKQQAESTSEVAVAIYETFDEYKIQSIETNRQEKRRAAREIIGICVVVVYTTAAILQWGIMQGQLDQMRESDRAFLYASTVETEEIPHVDYVVNLSPIVDNKYPTVHLAPVVRFGNTSKAPILRAQKDIYIIPANNNGDFVTAASQMEVIDSIHSFCPTRPEPIPPLDESILSFMHKQPFAAFPGTNNDFSELVPNAIAPKTSRYAYRPSIYSVGSPLWIIGCFKYETSGELHHTAFCFFGAKRKEWQFSRCAFGGNYAD